MAILAHLFALFTLVSSPAEDPFKTLSLTDALTQAGAANKVVMVDFFTTWCPPCKQLDAVTWKDERVRAWLAASTVALKLDAEKEFATAKKHRISGYPTMVFLRPDGSELGRIVGFKGPEDFLKLAGNLLAKESAGGEQEAGPFKQLALADALAQAGAAGKVVMIDYFTTWCAPCKKLDAVTWKDERVRAWLAANTIALKLDAEKEAETATKHRVKAYPTMLFLRPDGTELGRIVGFREAEDFLKLAGDALAGKNRIEELQAELAAGGDVHVRRQLAGELAQVGRDAEALEHYLWCWDNGSESSGFGGVRASFMLSEMVSLGSTHPPALDALRQRRDACEAAVMGGELDFRQTSDLGSLNRALGNEQGTLRVYDALMAREDLGPDERGTVRLGLFDEVVDLLLEAGRYQDVLDGAEDYNAAVDDQFELYESTKAHFKDDPTTLGMMQAMAAAEAVKYYEALLGVGRLDDARKLGERLIAFDPAARTYRLLIRHAKAVKADVEVAALQTRLEALPPAEEPAAGAGSGD